MASEIYYMCFARTKGISRQRLVLRILPSALSSCYFSGQESAPPASGASAPGAAGARAAMVEMAASWSSTSQAPPSGVAATLRQLSRSRREAAGHAHLF